MHQKKVLLAVLGRGCMMTHPGGPWAPTGNFDKWDITPGVLRPEVLAEKDDDDPNSVIGGGELNLTASMVLYKELKPYLVVFAYGNRAPYLKSKNYPSESTIVTQIFRDVMTASTGKDPGGNLEVFDENFWNNSGSGTFQEVKNVLIRAKQINADEIVFVTVLVHMNRVLGMIAKHLLEPELSGLRNKIRFEVSESVALRACPKSSAKGIFEIFGSKSFIRNLEREKNGLVALEKGLTQSTQGLIQNQDRTIAR